MRKLLVLFVGLTLSSPVLADAPPQSRPIEVMVVGTFHFGNPGLDLVNVKAVDVTTPARQRELAILTDALARFRPTRVMVERETSGPDFAVKDYRNFTAARLQTDPDERVQIGYRLAARIGLRDVQGIDEQPSAGEPDYFPFDKVQAWAAAHGRQGELEAMLGAVQVQQKAFEARQATASIPELLLETDRPAKSAADHQLYTELLKFGDGESQPGADLNAMWFLRNAKIFAKLGLVAGPGDRVLVLYGAGHAYWLRQLVQTMPGYRLVEPGPYLRQAAGKAR